MHLLPLINSPRRRRHRRALSVSQVSRLALRAQLLIVCLLLLVFSYVAYTCVHAMAAGADPARAIQRDAYAYAPYARPVCGLRSWQAERYATLGTENKTVYIAANVWNAEEVLPTFVQEMPEVLRVLGPRNVFVSVYENGSTDKTRALLRLLGELFDVLGTPHSIISDPGAPDSHAVPGQRIAPLARARNAALAPLYSGAAAAALASPPFSPRARHAPFSPGARHVHGAAPRVPYACESSASRSSSPATLRVFDEVLFLNDVFHCAADVLELLHQKRAAGAHQACAVDWQDPVVYDRWVLRSMSGRSFYAHTDLLRFFNGDHALPPLLPHDTDAESRKRFQALAPLQVFSCWNGATAFDARVFLEDAASTRTDALSTPGDSAHAPILDDAAQGNGVAPAPAHDLTVQSGGRTDAHGLGLGPLRFRTSRYDAAPTDRASECFLPSVDLWRRGLGKVLLVPKASVAYSLAAYNRHRKDRLAPLSRPQETIDWALEPPPLVAMQDFAVWYEPERWAPWDEQ